jgi:hypothetical protein
MQNIWKKFDMGAYTTGRIRELRGERPPEAPSCPITEAYTSRRIRELRGEPVYWDTEEDKMGAYCSLWIREQKLENQLRDRKLLLDNRKLGSYTVVTMGDRDGET